MKKIKFLILITIGCLTVSCSSDYLSPEPVSAVNADNYFTNDTQLETGLVSMYDAIQGINSTSSRDNHAIQIEYQLTEIRSDNTRTKSSEGEPAEFESFNVLATNGVVADYYRSFYNVIYRSNLVLGGVKNASPNKAMEIEGEAKFVRAYAYFNLVRLFGDIPLVDKVITVQDTETQFTRVATSSIYELIVDDLKTAIDADLPTKRLYRASKSGAQALLAKVYLTLGQHSLAKSLLEDVMLSGYQLEDNFLDVFYKEEKNSENIFSISFVGDDSLDSQNFSAEMTRLGRSTGLNYVTDEAIAALEEIGGTRADSYRKDVKEANQYQTTKFLVGGDDNLGIAPTASEPTLGGNDWIVIRYADVLLMYVEAVMGTADETYDSAAVDAFQLVRNRAGLTEEVAFVSKQDLLDERRVELAFENQRFFDLVRFGVAQDVLSEFSAANGYGFSATDLLLPIPQGEIGLSRGMLSQNSGY